MSVWKRRRIRWYVDKLAVGSNISLRVQSSTPCYVVELLLSLHLASLCVGGCVQYVCVTPARGEQ